MNSCDPFLIANVHRFLLPATFLFGRYFHFIEERIINPAGRAREKTGRRAGRDKGNFRRPNAIDHLCVT